MPAGPSARRCCSDLIFPLLYWRMPRLSTKLLVLLIAAAIVTVVQHIPWPHGVEARYARSVSIVTRTTAAVPCGDRSLLTFGSACATGPGGADSCCSGSPPSSSGAGLRTCLESAQSSRRHGLRDAAAWRGESMSTRLLADRDRVVLRRDQATRAHLWHLPVMIVLVPAYRELLALIGPGVRVVLRGARAYARRPHPRFRWAELSLHRAAGHHARQASARRRAPGAGGVSPKPTSS